MKWWINLIFLSAISCWALPVLPEMEKAHALYGDGHHEEALALGRKVIANLESKLGEQNPELIDNLNRLTDLYLRAHLYSDGGKLRLRVLYIAESAKGSSDPLVADALFNLGWFYLNMARYAPRSSLRP